MPLPDAGCPALSRLSNLEELSLVGTNVTDGRPQTGELLELTHLRISGTKITDAGLVHLKHMTKLTVLSIGRNAGVTSDGLVHLASLSMLEKFEMRGVELTADGAEHLNRIPSLRHLELGGVPVGGNVSPGTLLSLARLKSVRHIEMYNTHGYSPEQLAALKTALPRVMIQAGYVHD